MSDDELFGIPRGLHELDAEEKERKRSAEERARKERERERNKGDDWFHNDSGHRRNNSSEHFLKPVDYVLGFVGSLVGLFLTGGEVGGAIVGAIAGGAFRNLLIIVGKIVKFAMAVGLVLLILYAIYKLLSGV